MHYSADGAMKEGSRGQAPGVAANRSPAPIPLWVALWAILIPVSLLARSYMPIDETRYVSVAWDMWLNRHFLVPHVNGALYSDKPPLLFWAFQLGWLVFGVNDVWPRIVPSLFGAASLLLTARIARRLWPERPGMARLAPLIVISSMLWTVFVTAAMFDMLVACFTLLGILGIVRSWQDAGRRGWVVLGGAIGLGILAKGPVILLHTLPPALLAPWWAMDRRPARWASWYAGVGMSVALGALIALAWAIPAAIAGGEQYARMIFWGQSAGRMVKSFAHQRPLWWYLPLLPLILFPWALWPPLWRSVRSSAGRPASSAVRLCLAWIVPVFVIFSLISGKQPHYLLPLFPAFALLAALALDSGTESRAWDAIVPALLLLAVGCALMMIRLVPFPGEYARVMMSVNRWSGAVLIAAVLAPVAACRLNAACRPALVSSMSVVAVIVLQASLAGVLAHFDMHDISAYVSMLEKENIPVCYVGKYSGTFNFLGRLRKPLDVIGEGQVPQWVRGHPEGRVIGDDEHFTPETNARPEHESPFGLHQFQVWKGSDLAGDLHGKPASG
jgi:4-amino-4-deoxy-L-arabinose transferase-like glycosyltransferase